MPSRVPLWQIWSTLLLVLDILQVGTLSPSRLSILTFCLFLSTDHQKEFFFILFTQLDTFNKANTLHGHVRFFYTWFIANDLLTKNSEYKTGYTTTQVAGGWAGAIIEVTWSFGQEQWGRKKKQEVKCDRRTDGRADGLTKRGVESCSRRLKKPRLLL